MQQGRLLYATASIGVKTGGFNNAITPSQRAYDEETNWTYEIGLKTVLMQHRMLFNIA